MRTLSCLLLLWCVAAAAQTAHTPDYYAFDAGLSDSLLTIVRSVNLDSTFLPLFGFLPIHHRREWTAGPVSAARSRQQSGVCIVP